MGDSAVTVIAIFLVAILMFMVPLMSTAENNDGISQIAVQKEVTEYVDQIRKTGKVTLTGYQEFLQDISVENKFIVEMEIQIAGENPKKKTVQVEITKNGEGIFYTLQSEQIMQMLQTEPFEIILKSGDRITVRAYNVNQTIAQGIKNGIFSLIGNQGHNISAQHSGVVLENGAKN